MRMSGKRKRKTPKEVIKIEEDDTGSELENGARAEEEESSSDDDNLERMRGGSVVPVKRGKKTGKAQAKKGGKKAQGKRLKA
jgi:hypothetical protein